MPTLLFANLPAVRFARTHRFYEALGYDFNLQFTTETTGCMVISDTIFPMFQESERFGGFTPKPIGQAHAQTEAVIAIKAPSREAVDVLVARAAASCAVTKTVADFHHAYSCTNPVHVFPTEK